MKKLLMILVLAALVSAFAATTAFAEGVEKEPGFVCPVLGGQAGDDHGDSEPGAIKPLGETGDYTIPGPDVNVPEFATNDNGEGTPGGDHASPGDTTYTAIWNK